MKTRNIYLLILLVMSMVVHAQQRIIGGSAVNITERPYQAAVFVNGTFNGGGVIISNRWILTAAHVVAARFVCRGCGCRHHLYGMDYRQQYVLDLLRRDLLPV